MFNRKNSDCTCRVNEKYLGLPYKKFKGNEIKMTNIAFTGNYSCFDDQSLIRFNILLLFGYSNKGVTKVVVFFKPFK